MNQNLNGVTITSEKSFSGLWDLAWEGSTSVKIFAAFPEKI